ncbi:anaerobic glycerol-3-phosphate dehydrogenase subunit B, partial [Salidesulfovibrio brasiliensis]|uniref:anaerobic glycerol-3-phosphate dehydrogenase subunit B n=1 Tax=Salidesulfovibrio brasiliensis TaxID=221711 RepID=UPI0006D26D4C
MADIIRCNLAIIGTGIAGMAASIFAAERGMSVAQAGNTGMLAYTTGYFDLLGAIPASEEGGKAVGVTNPFESLPALLAANPEHPYRFVDETDMRAGFRAVTSFLSDAGLHYVTAESGNFEVPSPAGTLKRTWSVPSTMSPAVNMLADAEECVIVDFAGLKGFSARQIAANLSPGRAGLRSETVKLPGKGGEVFTENVARMLETPKGRESFAEVLAPVVGDAKWLGLPACLGIYRPDAVLQDMQERLGVTIFEIPTMPPGVPGIRIKEAFEEAASGMDLHLFRQQKMVYEGKDGDLFKLRVVGTSVEREIRAERVLLATGRFLGGGLSGERTGIRETVL